MSNSFSFAEFIPEPLTYKDEMLGGDGTVYDVQVVDLLSTENMVLLMRVENQIGELTADKIRGEGIGKIEEMTNRLEALTDQMMEIVIPGLPRERRLIIPLPLRKRFIDWWRAEQGKAATGEQSTPPNAL